MEILLALVLAPPLNFLWEILWVKIQFKQTLIYISLSISNLFNYFIDSCSSISTVNVYGPQFSGAVRWLGHVSICGFLKCTDALEGIHSCNLNMYLLFSTAQFTLSVFHWIFFFWIYITLEFKFIAFGCSYHQVKIPIDFWCRQDLNSSLLLDDKRLYQLS